MKLEISTKEFEQLFKGAPGAGEAKVKGALKPATMELLFDEKKCCSCRLCETVCAQFHEGDANPLAARNTHVVRPIREHPEISGLTAQPPGYPPHLSKVTFGEYSEHSFCRQCISPECLFVCPKEAISLDPETRARVVDEEKCVGCGTCAKNCPWDMIRVNPETKKAVKCDLCGGDPQCAEWCPTDAITIKEV
jgi:Fe-S-cluster-containing dehydrogenase component